MGRQRYEPGMVGKSSEAAVIEPLGPEDDAPPAAGPPAAPKIAGQLVAACVVDQRHRAAHYPGSQRFKVRAVGGEWESAYVVAPAGPEAAALARAEYLRSQNIDPAQAKGVEVKPMPD